MIPFPFRSSERLCVRWRSTSQLLHFLDRDRNDEHWAGRAVVRHPQAQALVTHQLIFHPIFHFQIPADDGLRIRRPDASHVIDRNGYDLVGGIVSNLGALPVRENEVPR